MSESKTKTGKVWMPMTRGMSKMLVLLVNKLTNL